MTDYEAFVVICEHIIGENVLYLLDKASFSI